MAIKHYSRFHIFVQKLVATPAGSKTISGFWHRLDRAFLRLSKGRTSLTEIFAGLPMILLTSTGARSGLARTLPVACYRDPEKPEIIAVAAANWGREKMPSWYYNLRATPRASVLVDGKQKVYSVREAQAEEYEHYWKLAEATYLGMSKYRQRVGERRIPIMILSEENQ
ncbi:MAG: nitroreductase family deazaflavin-dependent oxidoreductase [Anaerolineaceae bacterium]|nr:nitroreductase family deazaflavin-dependent oxidoreductase [Anaerolineaceae bacterium]NLE90703.1 nitroreductase family deazaflavin-dependent oxidoreductase [Dehalococcoidales bacterium]